MTRSYEEMRGVIVGGKYRLEDPIALTGEMVTYRAAHLDLDHPVAVQIPTSRKPKGEAWSRAFRREVRVLSQLRHPNIAELHDFGQLEDGVPYLVVQYIAGTPLSARLLNDDPLDEAETVRVMRGIAQGLRYAHRLDVYHLALIPAHVVMMETFDEKVVKILNFLAGRWHHIDPSQPRAPSFRVAPPEVLRSEEPTPASDIYSLGLLAWACLDGRLPVPGTEETARAVHLSPREWELPEDWGISAHLQNVLHGCLRKEPDERYQSCAELLDALADWETSSATTLRLAAVQQEQVGFFPIPGDHFADKFRIEETVGDGGFARVFRATVEPGEARPVALKILRPDRTANAAEARRFVREGKLVFTLLSNPHTISVFDYGESDDGLLYIAFEYIDGSSLEELLETEGPFTPTRVARILEMCLASLSEAHELGVLHRDIKPGNVMLSHRNGVEDWVTVLDFGVAKITSEVIDTTDLTVTGTAIGTPRYMPPEQISGQPLGPESDLHSLGLVAYELLTGEKAVEGENTLEIIANQLDPQSVIVPADAGVPAPLAFVVNRLMRKERTMRYQSARDVLIDLRQLDREVGDETVDTSARS